MQTSPVRPDLTKILQSRPSSRLKHRSELLAVGRWMRATEIEVLDESFESDPIKACVLHRPAVHVLRLGLLRLVADLPRDHHQVRRGDVRRRHRRAAAGADRPDHRPRRQRPLQRAGASRWSCATAGRRRAPEERRGDLRPPRRAHRVQPQAGPARHAARRHAAAAPGEPGREHPDPLARLRRHEARRSDQGSDPDGQDQGQAQGRPRLAGCRPTATTTTSRSRPHSSHASAERCRSTSRAWRRSPPRCRPTRTSRRPAATRSGSGPGLTPNDPHIGWEAAREQAAETIISSERPLLRGHRGVAGLQPGPHAAGHRGALLRDGRRRSITPIR